MKKVLAIASSGGHWTQLLRIRTAFEDHNVVYVSTMKGYAKDVPQSKFYKVTDASQWSKLKLIVLFFELVKIVFKVKPQIIISTGAAPGVLCLLIGRLVGAKAIWLDSIANYEKVSLSGRIAKFFTHLHLTQWEHLQTKKTLFKGKVL
jgi:UDP-N-acetylglucosamine:LPS N-acetylglucosamine transferase